MARFAPIALLAAALMVGCQLEQPAVNHYAQGQALLEQGKLEAALEELQRAVRIDPHLAVAHSSIGDIHRKRGEYEMACVSYEAACEANPYAFRPHYNLGVTYQLLAEAARTVEKLQQYLRQAVQVYLRATSIEPDDFDANLNLSACYFQLGKMDLAEKYCEAAIHAGPGKPQGYCNRGIIYDSENRPWDAIKAFKDSLELDTNQPRTLIGLGRVYLRQGHVKEALHVFDIASRQEPAAAEIWEDIGTCRCRLADYPKAVEAYQKSLSLDAGSPSAHRGLGIAYMSQHLVDPTQQELRSKALTEWNKSLELRPDQDDLRKLVEKYAPQTKARRCNRSPRMVKYPPMNTTLERCLDDLSSRIDEEQEAANRRAWLEFLDGKCPTDIFRPPARKPSPPRVAWPDVRVNQTLDDFDAMLLQQFRMVSDVLEKGGRPPLSVRCNYGTGILPSMFGCELFLMADEQNTLPAARPLGSAEAVRKLLDAGVPDLRAGLAARTLDCGERFRSALASRPALERWVWLYHPDTQGPIDVAEVVWGSDIFYAFYEDTGLLRTFLDLVTETYVAFMRAWYRVVPHTTPYSVHWGLMHRGVIMLRDDSLMNLSPQAYVDFVRPLDERCFDAFGGGAIHFCGRCEHYIEPMSHCRGLTAVNLGQPHMNDMEAVCRSTIDKGIQVVSLYGDFAKNPTRPLKGMVHWQE